MLEAQDIILEVLPLKDQRWIDPKKITGLADQLGYDDIEAKIYFLRELTSIFRRLPIKIYESDDDRLRLLEALQEALDAAIDEEEEMLEAEWADDE